MSEPPRPRHHSPLHVFVPNTVYMVTASTLRKQPVFDGDQRLRLLLDALLQAAQAYGWQLQAWAVFRNHYHFVAMAPGDPGSLRTLIRHLHSCSAIEVNRMDGVEGRKVWHNYWDTHLTYETSFLARLNYVHENPVKHGLVHVADQYPWCSAAWFARTADPTLYKTVTGFRTDRVNVDDDF